MTTTELEYWRTTKPRAATIVLAALEHELVLILGAELAQLITTKIRSGFDL